MGLAVSVSAAADDIEEVAVATSEVIPADWTGRAAERYEVRAGNLGTALVGLGSRAHEAAALVHQHEQELRAVRTALGTGGSVAV